jgi:hypothetical protein
MAKNTRGSSENPSTSIHFFETGGELLDGETLFDPVLTGDWGCPQLLCFTRETITVAPEITHHGRLYRPAKLDPCLQKAMLLPNLPADYGDLAALLRRTCNLFRDWFDLDQLQAQLTATWVFTTWVGDQMPSPPRLSIYGINPDLAIDYFRLMRCVARRALILCDLCSFRKLPMIYRPTLLLNQAHPSRRMIDLLCDSNYQGVLINGTGNSIIDGSCSKALFLGNNGVSSTRWVQGSIPIYLPPTCARLDQLNARILSEIANEFQPYFLMYRLRYAARVRNGAAASSAEKDTRHTVLACFPDEPDLTRATLPLLQSLQEDSHLQSCDELVDALVEVLWAKLHEGLPEMAAADILELTNALLRARGGQREYNEEELGWKFRKLQIQRHKRRQGKVVQFSTGLRRHLHRLVRNMCINVDARVETCADCKESQVGGQ